MIFCADIGNAVIKCGVLSASGTLSLERIATPTPDAAVEVSLAVQRAAGVVLDVRGAIITSVVPELTRVVAVQISHCMGIRPIEVSHQIRLPLEVAVPVPSSVGADRICAAVGALNGGRTDAVVVDAGSAITVDIMRKGMFLGGIILPGPRNALRALHRHAAQLPRIDYADVPDPFPDNFDATEPSMVLGASLGAVGGILEAVRWLESRVVRVEHHVLTGGDSAALVSRLPDTWHHEPDLIMRGLYRIAELNLPG